MLITIDNEGLAFVTDQIKKSKSLLFILFPMMLFETWLLISVYNAHRAPLRFFVILVIVVAIIQGKQLYVYLRRIVQMKSLIRQVEVNKETVVCTCFETAFTAERTYIFSKPISFLYGSDAKESLILGKKVKTIEFSKNKRLHYFTDYFDEQILMNSITD